MYYFIKANWSLLVLIFVINSYCEFNVIAGDPGIVENDISMTLKPVGQLEDDKVELPSSEFIQLELSISSTLFNSQQSQVEKTIRAAIDESNEKGSLSPFSILLETSSTENKEFEIDKKIFPLG